MKLLFLIFVLGCVQACAGNDNEARQTEPTFTEDHQAGGDNEKIERLREQGHFIANNFMAEPKWQTPTIVSQQVQAMKQTLDRLPNCRDQKWHYKCQTRRVQFSTKPAGQKKNLRIMIIDAGVEELVQGIHRDRILGLLEMDSHGRYNKSEPVFESTAAFETLVQGHFTRESAPIPAFDVDSFSKEIFKLRPSSAVGHSVGVFGTIAAYNPSAEFILVPFPKNPKICDLVGGSRLRSRYRRDRDLSDLMTAEDLIRESLKDVIEEYEIDIINMSAGDSLEDLQADLAQCEGSSYTLSDDREQWIEKRKQLYSMLGSLNNTVFVQAAMQDRWLRNLDRAPFDCKVDAPNRLRIDYFPSLLPNSKYGDRFDSSRLLSHQKNAIECVDLYLNYGMNFHADEDRPMDLFHYDMIEVADWRTVLFDEKGLRYNVGYLSTSWAAPMATNYVAHYMKTNPGLSAQAVVYALTQGHAKPMASPIYHGQMNLCQQYGLEYCRRSLNSDWSELGN